MQFQGIRFAIPRDLSVQQTPLITLIALIALFPAGCSCLMRPSITAQPTWFDGNCGDTAVFAVAATGPGPLYYQWFWNGVYLYNGGRVSGANSPTLVITDLRVEDNGTVWVVVSNDAGSVASNTASLYIRDTLDYQISWPDGDLDIGVREPDGEVFYNGDAWYSDNGTFSDNKTNGGTERWILDRIHDTGIYKLMIWDWDYTGNVSITVYHNEMMDSEQTMVYYVDAGYQYEYTFYPTYVERSAGQGGLKFEVVKKPIPPDAVKPGPKDPSPRPFGG